MRVIKFRLSRLEEVQLAVLVDAAPGASADHLLERLQAKARVMHTYGCDGSVAGDVAVTMFDVLGECSPQSIELGTQMLQRYLTTNTV